MSQVLLGCIVTPLPTSGIGFDRPVQKKSKARPKAQTTKVRTPIKLHLAERQRGGGDTRAIQDEIEFLNRKGIPVLDYQNKEEMVYLALQETTDRYCLEELSLIGHGNFGVLEMGNGQSTLRLPSTRLKTGRSWTADWQRAFVKLKGRFCLGATLTLYGCNVGAGSEGAKLVFDLSQYFGIHVRAPVGEYGAGGYGYHGRWQEAWPNMSSPPAALIPTDAEYVPRSSTRRLFSEQESPPSRGYL